MKKLIPTLLLIAILNALAYAQNAPGKAAKINMPATTSFTSELKENTISQKFLSIHKEKDSPFEIYQDLQVDELVIRLKNQFDVLRFEIRDIDGKTMPVKGIQDKNEVHASLKDLVNGRYRLIVDRNQEKILTELHLNREK